MATEQYFKAAQDGNLDEIKPYIEQKGIDVNTKDSDDRTALHWAAAKGHSSIVSYFLNHNANPKTVDDGGWSPLISAASAGHIAVVRLLLGITGIDPNEKTSAGRTPLHYACSKGYSDIVELLLENGAKVTKDETGATAYHRAAAKGSEKIIRMLLKKEPRYINTQDNAGCTALHMACANEQETCIRVLLQNGADMEIQDKEEKIALELAPPSMHKIIVAMKDLPRENV